jgi:hypothetical protein
MTRIICKFFDAKTQVAGLEQTGSDRCTARNTNLSTVQEISNRLFDPNDPLVSSQGLIQSAAEVLSELRSRLLSETPPTIIDTGPEWLDASCEYQVTSSKR